MALYVKGSPTTIDGFLEDVIIWEHKTCLVQPLLCDGDGPIIELPRWYAQFYAPSVVRGPRRQLSCFGERAAIYVIHTNESGKSYWNRAGVAFGNRDGSFTFKLDVFPQTKFQLREEKPVATEEAAE
jgi:hypothetical protein